METFLKLRKRVAEARIYFLDALKSDPRDDAVPSLFVENDDDDDDYYKEPVE